MSMAKRLRRLVKTIPGASSVSARMHRLSVTTADALGVVPRKEAQVSRAYWQQRAVTQWDEDCASAANDLTYRQALSETVDELRQLEWNSLLEVGCGFGRVLRALRAAFPDRLLVGGDFSFDQLQHAVGYLAGQQVGIAQVEAHRLPFADRQFDIVLTSSLLIYVHPDELPMTLREFKRVGRRSLVLVENAKDFLDTPRRRQLMRTAPFYGHVYTPALREAGIPVTTARLMQAWATQPERLPLSLFLGRLS